jgi:hypothetical protein
MGWSEAAHPPAGKEREWREKHSGTEKGKKQRFQERLKEGKMKNARQSEPEVQVASTIGTYITVLGG